MCGMLFTDSLLIFLSRHALPMLSYFQTRSIKQTTVFRGPLQIGSQLKINVYGYVRVGFLIFFSVYVVLEAIAPEFTKLILIIGTLQPFINVNLDN